ncbi:hypothetical protein CYLTODRAFT_279516 [Cylindrobasidium torrendii FP15055 ss-10]|uniref:Uncharacterized protein n=1 Tax=Cylindrobasidium torrendii FP15055 ss-10 TaxID=1314674 RepID=A0A0D7BBC0_9AGAR|nr:hypothetical protein CYLTODRAFT_279516 [Cylindrobasidium torrendii FP15055 ss-10]
MPLVVGVPNLLFSIPGLQDRPEDLQFLQDSFERLAFLWDALSVHTISAWDEYKYSKEMQEILHTPRFRALFKEKSGGEKHLFYSDEVTQERWRAIREKEKALTPERLEAMRITADRDLSKKKHDRLFAKPPNPIVNPAAGAVRTVNTVKTGGDRGEGALGRTWDRLGRAIR